MQTVARLAHACRRRNATHFLAQRLGTALGTGASVVSVRLLFSLSVLFHETVNC